MDQVVRRRGGGQTQMVLVPLACWR
jgi:hypothetical protein